MSSLLVRATGIMVPEEQDIKAWSSISNPLLMRQNVSAAPDPAFVQMENEKYYGHSIYRRDLSIATAVHDMEILASLNRLLEKGWNNVNGLYSYRGVAKTLQTISDDTAVYSEATVKAAKPLFDKLMAFAEGLLAFSDDGVREILSLFQRDIWRNGTYSDELIDMICQCFFVMVTIDEMKTVKTSFMNDVSFLRKRSAAQAGAVAACMTMNNFFASSTYCETGLLAEMKQKIKDIQLIQQIFTTRIMNAIQTRDYLRPEMLFVFIRNGMLWASLDGCPQPFIDFMAKMGKAHPILPLAYEVSYDTEFALKGIMRGKKCAPIPPIPADTSISRLKELVSDLSHEILLSKQEKVSPKEFVEYIMTVIKDVGAAKNYLREQLVQKLAKPAAAEEGVEMCKFERSLRKGYNETEIHELLKALMMWRTLTDTLKNASGYILQVISPYFYQCFHKFLKDQPFNHVKDKKKYGDKAKELAIVLEEVLCDWDPNEERNVNFVPDKKKDNKKPKRTIKSSIAAPSPISIEFLRIELQHILRSEKGCVITGKIFEGSARDDMADFVKLTSSWAEFLNFGGIIQNVSDMSELYFKEVQLDLNRGDLEKQNLAYFPVRSSIPFILGEFALKNFFVPELTEMLFYPLGIYNDAAHVAQYRLGSQFLLNEIKAEAKTCVKTLSFMIAEYTFEAFRAYTSIRFLPETVYNSLKGQLEEWLDSPAYRLSVLLKQNQFYLLSEQIDVKAMILKRIEHQMSSSISKLLKYAQTTGIPSLVAVSKGLDIICETHRLLIDQGLTLLPYEQILRSAMGALSPNSFQTAFVKDIITGATHRISKGWYFRSNPMRLIPLSKKSINQHAFGKGVLGHIIRTCLDPVVNIITVEHFCCLSRLLDEGSLVYAANILVEDFNQLVLKFISVYTELHAKKILRRITDPPLSTPGKVVFDRFESAYMFLGEPMINDLISLMGRIGNILTMAHMLDVAWNSKKNTRSHIIGWLRGIDLDLNMKDQLDTIVGKEVASVLSDEDPIPSDGEVYPITVSRCLSRLITLITKTHCEEFQETSKTILDLKSLTSFGATWSILEYIFVMTETFREKGSPASPFEIFGEGVIVFAAAMIQALDQERICFATNIGRRLQRIRLVDYSASCDERIEKFCVCERFEASCMKWAHSVYRPIVGHLLSAGLLEK